MLRLRLALPVVALIAGASLGLAASGAAAALPSIVGTWSGRLVAPAGSHVSSQHFTFVVDRGERAGTWRTSPTCGGKLRLKDISSGYHHYYRLGARGCAAPGIDCLKRSGAQMVDVFVANGGGPNISGQFRRIR